MVNHCHLVIQINQEKASALTDEDVISRGRRLFSVPALVELWLQGKTEGSESEVAVSSF